mmetsp:Transcript_24308/g.60566  ORF Transcript_24308/g.60566 Transcript_24308/m.60566 type:complete len:102 (-) Transcript_24308:707-1012(-)
MLHGNGLVPHLLVPYRSSIQSFIDSSFKVYEPDFWDFTEADAEYAKKGNEDERPLAVTEGDEIQRSASGRGVLGAVAGVVDDLVDLVDLVITPETNGAPAH